MAEGPGSLLRHTAATLVSLSGIALIAALWLRELTPIAVLDVLLGTTYVIIGIGLFGHSRFSLLTAIVIPGAALGLLLHANPQHEPVYFLRGVVDLTVVLLGAVVLWETRHHPGV